MQKTCALSVCGRCNHFIKPKTRLADLAGYGQCKFDPEWIARSRSAACAFTPSKFTSTSIKEPAA